MASKVTSTYYIGNVPIYSGSRAGAHTQNGCAFNINIRVKPEVNTVGFMFIRTNDPLIHSLDNTSMAPNFELDLSNLNRLITLLECGGVLSPTIENEFLKLGVTSLAKMAEKLKVVWVKAYDNFVIFILENNGVQEQFVIEGVFQKQFFLNVLKSARDMYIHAKIADELNSANSIPTPVPAPYGTNTPPYQPQQAAPSIQQAAPYQSQQATPSIPAIPQTQAAPSIPQAAPSIPQAAPSIPAMQAPSIPAMQQQAAPSIPQAAPSIPAMQQQAAPSIPQAAPSIPQAAPSIPQAAPSIPQAAPSVPGSGISMVPPTIPSLPN